MLVKWITKQMKTKYWELATAKKWLKSAIAKQSWLAASTIKRAETWDVSFNTMHKIYVALIELWVIDIKTTKTLDLFKSDD